MRKEKHTASRSGMKVLIALTGLVLVVGCAICGTLAWLIDTAGPVTNTFTAANIDVELSETFNTDTDGDSKNDVWQAQMIPGYSYDKDPKVEVSGDSVDCYLFVKFVEENDPSAYLTYTSTLSKDNGWIQGDGTNIPNNVWYRIVRSGDTTRSWNLLDGNTVTVKDTVTKDNMENAAKAKLTYTAYASQLMKNADTEFTAAQAWENIG